MIDFAFPYLLQFIREYTGKVDELIKDKIEAQKEVKAKEQEEKDVIAQQNSNAFYYRTCMHSCYLLPCPHRQCQAWEVLLHHPWEEWECLQCQLSACHQWAAI
ncbi:hypothetical protein Gorai_002163, partial [Gossypium raimondii]|nr:hypothetical protein [Gossypium raimondii]